MHFSFYIYKHTDPTKLQILWPVSLVTLDYKEFHYIEHVCLCVLGSLKSYWAVQCIDMLYSAVSALQGITVKYISRLYSALSCSTLFITVQCSVPLPVGQFPHCWLFNPHNWDYILWYVDICSAVQFTAVQCNAVQCNAVQCNEVQCNVLPTIKAYNGCNVLQRSTLQGLDVHYKALHYTTQH